MGTKIPTADTFLKMKDNRPKKEPVWVYLEREMKRKARRLEKPYNQRVGDWLKFLKEMKRYQYFEDKKKFEKLKTEVGPSWFCELPTFHRNILKQLQFKIHRDLLEDLPTRTRRAMWDLGVTIHFKTETLLKAMKSSAEDPGVFIWNLYTDVYKMPPCEPRKDYDMNSKLLMSCLAYVDMEETIATLEKITEPKPKASVVPVAKTKKPRPVAKELRFGTYLQKSSPAAPFTPSMLNDKAKTKVEFDYKINLKSAESLENIRRDSKFLVNRKARSKESFAEERICHYKFWEPPSSLRNKDPRAVEITEKLRMLRKSARIHAKAPFNNEQFRIEGVVFSNGAPHYIINNSSVLPTGYIVINAEAGYKKGSGYIPQVDGHWRYPITYDDFCDVTCDCLKEWEAPVMKYVKGTKCMCGHFYDFHHAGKASEKFFYQPTRHGPGWFDEAQIFQMDPMENFVRDTVQAALVMSRAPTPPPPKPHVRATDLEETQLIGTLLGDLSNTALIIPHLPEANQLCRLKNWARQRVKGKLTPKQQKNLHLHTLRMWNDLEHIKYREPARLIPISSDQLYCMTWNHRKTIDKLAEEVRREFVYKNKLKQIEQSRMWWPSMKHDIFYTKSFLETYYTYMPTRTKDIFLINPYHNKIKIKRKIVSCY